MKCSHSRQGKVTIRPLVKPNSLLLIGRPDSVETVRGLIAKLDQPAKPKSQLKVFPLKYISATDAETTILSFYVDRLSIERAGSSGSTATATAPGLGHRVNAVAVTDFRVNMLVV